MTTASDKKWLIYGAYGYTGELVTREAVAHGKRPVVAGRNIEKLKPLALKHGLSLRAFDVADAAEHLSDIDIVINCAGPFAATAEAMMNACVAQGIHYFDVTGEISVFESAHRKHEKARQSGNILCPGVGFDIVPTDCLAALLKQELPDASHLELAFDFGTLPSIGTARTAIQGIKDGCLIRENGQVTSVGLGYRIRKVPFVGSPRWAVSFPWGDVFTSQISTAIPNAIVYAALPYPLCWGMKLANPLRGILSKTYPQKALNYLAESLLRDGPSETTRHSTSTSFWGRVVNQDGRECSGTITGPSVYSMTAETAVAIALEAEQKQQAGGYYTASMLVGADFLTARKGYSVKIHGVSKEAGFASVT